MENDKTVSHKRTSHNKMYAPKKKSLTESFSHRFICDFECMDCNLKQLIVCLCPMATNCKNNNNNNDNTVAMTMMIMLRRSANVATFGCTLHTLHSPGAHNTHPTACRRHFAIKLNEINQYEKAFQIFIITQNTWQRNTIRERYTMCIHTVIVRSLLELEPSDNWDGTTGVMVWWCVCVYVTFIK